MKFFDLPQFIIQHIFEYDSTYYQLFKKMVYCEIDKTYKRQFYEIINNDIVVIDADFDNEFSYGLNTCFRKCSICKNDINYFFNQDGYFLGLCSTRCYSDYYEEEQFWMLENLHLYYD